MMINIHIAKIVGNCHTNHDHYYHDHDEHQVEIRGKKLHHVGSLFFNLDTLHKIEESMLKVQLESCYHLHQYPPLSHHIHHHPQCQHPHHPHHLHQGEQGQGQEAVELREDPDGGQGSVWGGRLVSEEGRWSDGRHQSRR